MLTRLAGTSFAMAITMLISTGIIVLVAYEFLGDTGMRTVWDAIGRQMVAAPQNKLPVVGDADEFNPRKEIHFFETVPVEGTDLLVSTGAAYPSVAAVEARKPVRQWCYINVSYDTPGLSGRVDLGSQNGDSQVVYTSLENLIAAGLESRGLAARRLSELALSHCRFNQLVPVS